MFSSKKFVKNRMNKIVEKTPLSFSNQKPIQYHWHHGFLSKICVFSKSRKLTHVSLIISYLKGPMVSVSLGFWDFSSKLMTGVTG